jgi:hypothetical protein
VADLSETELAQLVGVQTDVDFPFGQNGLLL